MANRLGVNGVIMQWEMAISSVKSVLPREIVMSVESPCVMCIYCVDVGTFECCGKNLCGGEDKHKGSCTDKHVVKTLDCGHKGCNYHDGACLSCENEKATKVEKDAVKGDVAIIESIMDQIKSDSMKAALKSILGDTDGKKRKREVERVEELEFNLKRARNACSACRCGRASYY